MAVLNTTPDSFFDGGRYKTPHNAKRRIDEILEHGADIIDIGAESTRPGATEVSASQQLERLGQAVEYAVQCGVMVSVDTASPTVAREVLSLGARVINDVSCLKEPELAHATAEMHADLIVMHSRGSMKQMPGFSDYDGCYSDVVRDVAQEWSLARDVAISQGMARERIWFDPGLGFHKSAEQSDILMRRLAEFSALGARIVLGASRKSFIGALDNSPPEKRLGGSIAACLRALAAGAEVLRVHDVHDVVQALRAYENWTPPLPQRHDSTDRDSADRDSAHKAPQEVLGA